MALAPDYNRQRKGGAKRVKTLVDTTPPKVFQLRNVLRGIHWTYQKRLLDMLQLLVANDRQFEIAREMALDVMSEHERMMAQAVTKMLTQEVVEESTDDGKAAA